MNWGIAGSRVREQSRLSCPCGVWWWSVVVECGAGVWRPRRGRPARESRPSPSAQVHSAARRFDGRFLCTLPFPRRDAWLITITTLVASRGSRAEERRRQQCTISVCLRWRFSPTNGAIGGRRESAGPDPARNQKS